MAGDTRIPITQLPVAGTVSKTDQLLVQGNSTQRATLAKILSDLSIVNPDMAQGTMLRIMVPTGAGAHTATLRGKNLGGRLPDVGTGRTDQRRHVSGSVSGRLLVYRRRKLPDRGL